VVRVLVVKWFVEHIILVLPCCAKNDDAHRLTVRFSVIRDVIVVTEDNHFGISQRHITTVR